jgi:ferredoxin-NADP reductase/Ca2+-binding EF-hand superfamily protein
MPLDHAVDAELLATLEHSFRETAGPDGRIDAPDLARALGLRSEHLARRVLRAFDTSGDGVVSRDEFLAGVRALLVGTDRDKLAFAFRVLDENGDGYLSERELWAMIALAMAESQVAERATQPAAILARTLFSAMDRDKDGRVSLDELAAHLATRPALLRQTTRSEAQWIAPNEDLLARLERRGKTRIDRARRYLENHGVRAVVLVLFAVAHVAIVASSLARYAGTSPAVAIGRAAGACLDLDGALILVPVMRRLLGRLRSTFLGRALPIDDAVDLHKLVGHVMLAVAAVHVGAFVAAYGAGHPHQGAVVLLFETWRGLTGLLLSAVFLVMWVFALGVVRRSRRFELFYFTHLAYVAWLALAIAHAPSFLLFAGAPLLGFVAEQLWRLGRRGKPARVLAVEPLRSGVTRLVIERPAGFEFGAGDYVFLRVPDVARHEWHPFTLSSAPERAELTVHVRSLGNWTAALRALAEARRPGAPPLVAYVDGPYGSPSAHVFDARFAVFIGAGIGVTPFASILESVVLRANGGRPTRLEHAHFFWLARDHWSFEWFAGLLREIERKDARALLDMHLCMTAGRSGVTSLALEAARELMHAIGRTDIVTGLRAHTHMGHPDWDTTLAAIAARHAPERVDVFFCGPPGLAKKLRPLCQKHGLSFREERF